MSNEKEPKSKKAVTSFSLSQEAMKYCDAASVGFGVSKSAYVEYVLKTFGQQALRNIAAIKKMTALPDNVSELVRMAIEAKVAAEDDKDNTGLDSV